MDLPQTTQTQVSMHETQSQGFCFRKSLVSPLPASVPYRNQTKTLVTKLSLQSWLKLLEAQHLGIEQHEHQERRRETENYISYWRKIQLTSNWMLSAAGSHSNALKNKHGCQPQQYIIKTLPTQKNIRYNPCETARHRSHAATASLPTMPISFAQDVKLHTQKTPLCRRKGLKSMDNREPQLLTR